MKKSNLKYLIPVLVLFLFDRGTKIFFLSRFSLGESKAVWGDHLRLTLVYNKGAAFGSLQNSQLFLIGVSAIALIILLGMLLCQKMPDKMISSGLILIISGACGNLYDRIVYGHVIDFIDVNIPDILKSLPRWPVFNIADSCITIGILIIILQTLIVKEEGAHASRSV